MSEWGQLETRADGTILKGADGRIIRGYPVVFYSLSRDLGGFREQIAPEAVQRTLREGDVHALFNHDASIVLGRRSAGTLRLDRDAHGMAAAIDPPDPIYPPNLLESIRRLDITGMSFKFRVVDPRNGGEEWDFRSNPPVRTILDMEIREISIVTFPAYPDTEVAVRSFEEAKRDPSRWKPSLKFRERELRAKEAARPRGI